MNTILVIGMIWLALYVLSVGPATWLHKRGYINDSARVFYRPLIRVVDTNDLLRRAAVWYTGLWAR